MSLYDDVTSAIHREIAALNGAIALSPTVVALAVKNGFADSGIEPHIEYTSIEHLKQMSRRILAGRFDADGEENTSHQGEMFTGHLQERYPVPPVKNVEPTYKKLNLLSKDELAYNIAHLKKSAVARLQHADALQAYCDEKSQSAAA